MSSFPISSHIRKQFAWFSLKVLVGQRILWHFLQFIILIGVLTGSHRSFLCIHWLESSQLLIIHQYPAGMLSTAEPSSSWQCKRNLRKGFSEVIKKKKYNYSFSLIFRSNFCLSYQRWTRCFWVCFQGVGLLWFFPLSFSGPYVSRHAHFFNILALVHINCLALSKCWESQSWKLAYLNIEYMSLYIKFFLPPIKYLCVVCFRNLTEKDLPKK